MGGTRRKRFNSNSKIAKRLRLSADQGPNRGNSESQSRPSSANQRSRQPSTGETPEYEINAVILCQHTDNNYYEAKIIKVDHDDDGKPMYTIHYKGWNSRYDEALTSEDAQDRFLEYTEENRNYAKEMIAQSMAKSKKSGSKRKDEKSQKSARRSTSRRPNTSGAVTPSRESAAPPEVVEEQLPSDDIHVTGSSEDVVLSVKLTDEICKILEKDAQFLISSTKLVKIPATKPISQIFEEFKKHYLKKPNHMLPKNILETRVDMVKAAFNDNLQSKLLYRSELLQYLDILNKLIEDSTEISHRDYGNNDVDGDESGIESEASDDDSALPSNEPSYQSNARLTEEEDQNARRSFIPDFTTQYGLIHFLRFCSNVHNYYDDGALPITIYNYIVGVVNDILEYITPKVSEYYNVQKDYENPSSSHIKKGLDMEGEETNTTVDPDLLNTTETTTLSATTESPTTTEKPLTCQCDDYTTLEDGNPCSITLDYQGNPTAFNGGCICVAHDPYHYVVNRQADGVTYIVTCEAGTTTTTTTVLPLTDPDYEDPPVVGPGIDPNATEEEEEEDEPVVYTGPCNITAIQGNKRNITKIFFYVASFWVILWTIITIITNIVCKETGHHRFIGLLEELAIIVLWVFLGFFVWDPLEDEMICKVTGMVLHFVPIMIMGCFVFEAIFARSIIKGSSQKDGSIPPFVNYIIPILIPIAPVAISYLQLKEYYASTGVHCFVVIFTDMLWAYMIPPWALLIIAVIIGQLAFIACKKALPDVDGRQLFWAKKMCKALPILSVWILTPYFLAMFSLDMQKFWLMIVYLVSCLVLGPVIFICHTYCYQKTATTLWKKTSFSVYEPCPEQPDRPLTPPRSKSPEKPTPENPPPTETPPKEDPPCNPYAGPPPMMPPRPVQPNRSPVRPVNDIPTNSMDFYSWVTNRNMQDINQSENVLFKRK